MHSFQAFALTYFHVNFVRVKGCTYVFNIRVIRYDEIFCENSSRSPK